MANISWKGAKKGEEKKKTDIATRTNIIVRAYDTHTCIHTYVHT